MKSNNFIDTAVDDYYLNPYKFTKNNTVKSNKKSTNNLNYIIKTLTSIIMSGGELTNEIDNELTDVNNLNRINDEFIIFKLVANDNINKLIKLLDGNKNENLLNINIQDNDGDTALHIAIFLSNYNACRVLILHDADIYIKDKWGQTPLHRLCFAVENENIIKIIELINQKQKYSDKKNNIFNVCDNFNNTPLHLVIKYILKNKIKLNKNILSVLHKLISLTDIDIINNDGLSSKDLLDMLDISK